ncbi:RNA polymerase sigma factor [Paenibacillus sp. USHLN196]|uniref:RNA polymerase sigma factor n=1 Tax=Paenibacillus sp. USHLN196 TaxID=3081291 RepID=UPI00301A3923
MDLNYLFHQSYYDLPPPLQKSVYRSFYNLVHQDITYLLGRDHVLTEDIIQESFLKVISNVNKYKIDNSKAWLRQVTRNCAMDYLRKTKLDRQSTDIASLFEDNKTLVVQQISVALEVEEKLRDEALRTAITELKQDYQTIITLFYIEEMSYKEIAKMLGHSEQAISQKLARARKKLLHQFLKKWVEN